MNVRDTYSDTDRKFLRKCSSDQLKAMRHQVRASIRYAPPENVPNLERLIVAITEELESR